MIKDDQADSVGNTQEKPEPRAMHVVNLDKQEKPEPRAMSVENSESVFHNGNCEYCKASFKKKTTWQRFCCDDCRNTAHEQRTGKKLNFVKKKTAGQGV